MEATLEVVKYGANLIPFGTIAEKLIGKILQVCPLSTDKPSAHPPPSQSLKDLADNDEAVAPIRQRVGRLRAILPQAVGHIDKQSQIPQHTTDCLTELDEAVTKYLSKGSFKRFVKAGKYKDRWVVGGAVWRG